MQLGNWRISPEWGHIAFATAIAGITWWYFQDVTGTSMNRNNIILVYPLSLLILGLYALTLIKSIHVERISCGSESTVSGTASTEESDEPQTNEQEQSTFDMVRALILLILLGAFVFSYNIVGLDLATFIFITLSLVLLGYRRWLFVVFYALAFTIVVIGGATFLLSYPMPTLIL